VKRLREDTELENNCAGSDADAAVRVEEVVAVADNV
jgi:hypothetical protein